MVRHSMKKNILVVVAHPDDEIIGCGGTLARHYQNGDKITIIYMTDGVSSRGNCKKEKAARKSMAEQVGEKLGATQYYFDYPDNQMDQTPLLKVVQSIESISHKLTVDIVYTHHGADLNIDHRIVHQAVMTAYRPIPGKNIPNIYTFEVNSSSEWNTPNSSNCFMANYFVNISDQITEKIALLSCYQKEMPLYPHSRSIETIEALAKVRGSSVGVAFAEAFMLIRQVEQ